MHKIPGHEHLLWAKCHLQTQKAVPWLNDLRILWGEELGKVGRQFQVEPVWFLFAGAG